ncbi:isoprenylcysteine carboxyl methyltransferase [Lucifera butyrica]|uniref:Isoprenylcysteine carboxyl methyltransferase n=1 Tax=Lucifera butyrica TaxID=1351585 RepID=A0A498R429_9FIRM|nr:isoprenylcysteine carboxylmethyltransferase family protein [Lucifera butyrica]VBB07436.1 isoprenylcysteine carboxyl methyltransferase [Lucifera butyrica]
MVVKIVMGLVLILAAERCIELSIAYRNRRYLMSLGAREFGARHYPLFFVLHGGWLIGWPAEALIRGAAVSDWWPAWAVLLITAQSLRYWCILSLGKCWNTRVLVLPGSPKIYAGPYRYLSHPNYGAVIVELAVVPLLFQAWITAIVASAANFLLLWKLRLPAERQALELLKD